MTFRPFLGPALAALITLALAHLGLTRALGAHPIWQISVAWAGILPGLALAFLLPRFGLVSRTRIITCILLLSLAYLAAHSGKTRFAASYAEDALAGKFWYFGWIATMATLTALLSTALSLITRDRSKARKTTP